MVVEHERDLLAALLSLNEQSAVEPFLSKVVELARAATGAELAYLAVGPGFASAAPRWWLAHALEEQDISSIRMQLSTTLLEQAAEDGLVHTVDALVDPRFRDRPSVRDHQIRGVLCVALHPPGGQAPIGVLYLMGPPERFDEQALALARVLGGHLGPLAQRLLASLRGDETDPTEALRSQLPADRLVGQSPALANVLQSIRVASAAPVPVLLTGPTGTGKSTIAQVLHEASGPPERPFVAVNAAHLPRELALAELFGARRGAYTGLDRDRAGLVEEANGGTLFFDEVVELSLEVQAQLLTFLQDGTYRRLGETQNRRIEAVRIVSATNRDPQQAVADGILREDLLFRLSAFRIDVPALDVRPADIVPLAFSLVDRHARRLQIRSRPLSAAACAWLEGRRWPGNVRELENVVQTALLWAHSEDASSIRPKHFEQGTAGAPSIDAPDLRTAVARFKHAFAQRILDEVGGNKSEAARRLGIHRSHLHDLLRTPSS